MPASAELAASGGIDTLTGEIRTNGFMADSLAANRDRHLVQMPVIVGPRSNAAKIPGDR
jgi:hypothetical protein